jgi:acyl carrier protein
MFERVVELISKFTEVPKEKITPETNIIKDLGLASMDFTDLICDFEEEFQTEVPERDLRKIVKVRDIVSYIEKKA